MSKIDMDDLPVITGLPAAQDAKTITEALQDMTICCIDRVSLSLSTVRLIAYFSATIKYSYDITCVNHDRTICIRAMLHPELASLVEIGQLVGGMRIKAKHAQFLVHVNSTYKTTRSAILLRAFTITGFDSDIAAQPAHFLWDYAHSLKPLFPAQHSNRRPLFARRSHYLPLHADDAMSTVPTWSDNGKRLNLAVVAFGAAPSGAARLRDAEDDKPAGSPELYFPPDKPSIQDMIARSQIDGDRRRKRPRAEIDYPPIGSAAARSDDYFSGPQEDTRGGYDYQYPIIGRLSAVSRVIHYGNDSSDVDYPMHFTFSLVDESRSLNVTVWNKAASWYHTSLATLPLGTLIAITGYRLKLWQDTYEASLNEKGPRGRVYVVAEKDAALFHNPIIRAPDITIERFPAVNLAFQSSRHVQQLADGARCSMVGVVSRVGPICVHLAASLETEDGDKPATAATDAPPSSSAAVSAVCSHSHSCYRWVWLRDHKTWTDTAVKLFSNSRWHAFMSIQPGRIVALTHLSMCKPSETAASETPTAAATAESPWFLVSSKWTSIYVTDLRPVDVPEPALYAVGHRALSRFALEHPAVHSFRKFAEKIKNETTHPWYQISAAGHAIRHNAITPYVSSLYRPPTLGLYVALRSPQNRKLEMLPLHEFVALMNSYTQMSKDIWAGEQSKLLQVHEPGTAPASSDHAVNPFKLAATYQSLLPRECKHAVVVGRFCGLDKVLPIVREDRRSKKAIGVHISTVAPNGVDDLDDNGVAVHVCAGEFDAGPYQTHANKFREETKDAEPLWCATVQDNTISTVEMQLLLHSHNVLQHKNFVPTGFKDIDVVRSFLPEDMPTDAKGIAAYMQRDQRNGVLYAFCVSIYMPCDVGVGESAASVRSRAPRVRVECIYRIPPE